MADTLTLFEIEAMINKANAEYDLCFDPETGEIDAEKLAAVTDMLDALDMAKERKLENIACLIKNVRGMAEAIKAEKLALAKRQAAAERKAEWLSDYVSRCLSEEVAAGQKKWTYARAEIAFRKSDVVIVDDMEKLDEEFVVVKREASKTAIKKALKGGAFVTGAHIEESLSMSVK